MNMFKETDLFEKNKETDRPFIRETDKLLLSADTEPSSYSFSDSSDIFEVALKKLGLAADTSEEKTDANQYRGDKEYTAFLEKSFDGKYLDKGNGKAYESIENWEKTQETLAKRYNSTAKYYEGKAKKEWAHFKNAEKRNESDAGKWDHYYRSQESYAKVKELKEKSIKTWAKLHIPNETLSESNQNSLEKEYQDRFEHKEYLGRELLLEVKAPAKLLAQEDVNPEDAERLKDLCDKISYNSVRDDNVEPTGALLPEYRRLMNKNGYESISEMCNIEGVNLDEIYDDEPLTYGEEYQKGFVDCIDKIKSPYITPEDECSAAYYQGLCDAQELHDLLFIR